MQHAIENPTPFHRGEIAIQQRYGVAEKTLKQGQRVMRDHMLEQHRQFFEQLPFVIVGSVDPSGQPWASILVGGEGFINSPDAQHLNINAQPLYADPLGKSLHTSSGTSNNLDNKIDNEIGTDIGLLGIQLDSRRRNRLNGQITGRSDQGFTLQVTQSFGNCPKYIHQRQVQFIDAENQSNNANTSPKWVTRTASFTNEMRELIQRSDTAFIASQFSEASQPGEQNNYHGVDVSHRGGKPGFIKLEDNHSLLMPDFAGNNHFNTFGNLLLNPKAGFLIIDFDSSAVLYLTGSTEILFDHPAITQFDGAERLLRFTLAEAILVNGSLPLRWQFQQHSKFVERTGDWASLGKIETNSNEK